MSKWLSRLLGQSPPSEADELVRGFRKRLESLKGTGPYAPKTDLAALERQLSGLPPREAGFLAGFALLLAEVASADLEVTEGERSRIAEVLRKHSRLDDSQAELVSRLALDRAAKSSVEAHLVFRRLNELCDHDRKRDIVRGLLYVAAEGDISEQESEQVSFLARALGVDRKEFLELRAEFREHLAVLKGL
jgi:uncharacterized tellurite resistance protein B-like protein